MVRELVAKPIKNPSNWMVYESKLIANGYEVEYKLKPFFKKIERQIGKNKMKVLLAGVDMFDEIRLKFPYLKASIDGYPHPSMFLVKEVRQYIYNNIRNKLEEVLDKFPSDENILNICIGIYKYRNKIEVEKLIMEGYNEKIIVGTCRTAERMCGRRKPDAKFYKWLNSVIKQANFRSGNDL
jgi:hypothetical protein